MKHIITPFYHRFFKRGFAGWTSSSRVLPNFIIIGTVRSGTTSLYYNICEHPSVLPAAYDEIGFFDSNYHLGIQWYRSMFPKKLDMNKIKAKTKYSITGEDTPFYIWNVLSAERILKILPNIKIIVQLRNPVNRAYSNYHISKKYGDEKLTFEKAIEKELEILEKKSFNMEIEDYTNPRSYIAKGLYYKQLVKWFKLFPSENILAVSTENMILNPESHMNEILNFLKIPQYTIKNPQQRKLEKYPEIENNMKLKLTEFFEPHNKELYQLIGKKFNWK